MTAFGFAAILIGIAELMLAAFIFIRWVGIDGSVEQFLANTPLEEIIRAQHHVRLAALAAMMGAVSLMRVAL